MQRGDFASGGWQKLIETLLTGLMRASVHEVPSKTPDVHFGGTDMTIAPWNVRFWPKADAPATDSRGSYWG